MVSLDSHSVYCVRNDISHKTDNAPSEKCIRTAPQDSRAMAMHRKVSMLQVSVFLCVSAAAKNVACQSSEAAVLRQQLNGG